MNTWIRFFGYFLDESHAINNKFYTAVDKIEDRRKKLIDSRLERAVDSMDLVYGRILSRVKGFRGNIHSGRLNDVLGRIRRRINRNRHE